MRRTLIFKGKRILRIGFFGDGRSNRALFSYLTENYDGITYTLRTDMRCPDLGSGKFSEILSGEAARKYIDEDILFLSPSVRRDATEFKEAEKRGVILSSDVEFFFENKKIPVFAVTGSDGKSTTATLASLMLSEKEGDFPASANIGVPMSALLSSEHLRGTVAELSSFQLMSTLPRTERALITNVTENHLDWHLSMWEYLGAKENVLKFTQKRIFNLDCPYSLLF